MKMNQNIWRMYHATTLELIEYLTDASLDADEMLL